jgi:hypothetical protein
MWNGLGSEKDSSRANAFWKEAAELGHREAQYCYGTRAFSESDWQRYHWLGKSAAWRDYEAMLSLKIAAVEQLKLYEEERRTGRVVFELGSTFKGHVDVTNEKVFDASAELEELRAVQRCVELHDEWTAAAKVAIECWLVVGRRHGMMKDIRLVIARLAWAERAAWSVVRK